MTKWQPIETAPKDHDVSVLGYCQDTVSEWVYNKYFNEWIPVSYSHHGCGCCAYDTDQPTHWQPLPEPPTE